MTFGICGAAYFAPPGAAASAAPGTVSSVALQPDGKVLAAGGAGSDFALARFQPNGMLDRTFGIRGRARTRFPGPAYATGMAVQLDGRIILGGQPREGGSFVVARYNSDGTLDKRFSKDGWAHANNRSLFEVNDVVVEKSGTITLVGRDSYGLAIARFGPRGTPLGTDHFSGFGTTTGGRGIAALPGGGTMVAATGGRSNGAAMLAIRLTSGGYPDLRFGDKGSTLVSFSDSPYSVFGEGNDVAAMADGTVVVAGRGSSGFAFARILTDGRLDSAFGSGGRLELLPPGATGFAAAVTLAGDEKIVAGGTASYDEQMSTDFALLRLLPNGTPDPSFSGDGFVLTDLGGYDSIQDIAVARDGSVFAAGIGGKEGSPASATGFLVGRYTPSGAIDRTFAGDGIAEVSFPLSTRINPPPRSKPAPSNVTVDCRKLSVYGQAVWLVDVRGVTCTQGQRVARKWLRRTGYTPGVDAPPTNGTKLVVDGWRCDYRVQRATGTTTCRTKSGKVLHIRLSPG